MGVGCHGVGPCIFVLSGRRSTAEPAAQSRLILPKNQKPRNAGLIFDDPAERGLSQAELDDQNVAGEVNFS